MSKDRPQGYVVERVTRSATVAGPDSESQAEPTNQPAGQEGASVVIPSAFREVFGERQPISVVVTVVAGGSIAAATLVALDPVSFSDVSWWRAALALLVIWDIACGCLANVTGSTNDYYARRPVHRFVFLAVHVHLILVALLLGAPLLSAVLIWAYTIFSASVVNRLVGSPHQLFVAVISLAGAVVVVPFLPDASPLMTSVSLLFVAKVVLAFAVDHTGAGARGAVEHRV